MMSTQAKIKHVKPRTEVEVHLPNGLTLSGPRGTIAGEFLEKVGDISPGQLVAAIVNDELRELTYPIEMEASLVPVTTADNDGARIYRRSLTFLLEIAFDTLFSPSRLLVDHSVTSGGYYCHVIDRPPLTHSEIVELDNLMRKLAAEDNPFERLIMPLDKTLEYFKKRNYSDKVRLLTHRRKDYVTLYRMGEYMDYHHGYMVPSTGYLKWFSLVEANGGFILRFPQRNAPAELLPMPEYPKLMAAFGQYGSWLEKLGIDSVGALDDAIQSGRTRELVLVSEALHGQHIAEIARQISEKDGQIRLVLIAGPSCSGKTTFSRRLVVQLLARGISPFALEIDHYFVDREDSPRDKDGQYDFELLEALDLDLLAEHLQCLVSGKRVQLPHFNFSKGKRESGEKVQLHPGQLVILEGIHGLNPHLIPTSLSERAFRIYASALTQLNLDRHNRVSTTDTRLVRRIVRDACERNYNAQQTIQRWESVRRGEQRHIFPFQENADVMFNSALVYELSVLGPLVEPLLRQVPHGSTEFIEAKRLLALLEWFLPINQEHVPDNSILREFIGGSILKDLHLWPS